MQELGLQPYHKVLEIGCGVLHHARYLIPYLDAGGYHGIDPNEWLRYMAIQQDSKFKELLTEKEAKFSSNKKFHSDEFGGNFDYIFSHSVLSHASEEQFELYLQQNYKDLKPTGISVASFRLGGDSHAVQWHYPDTTHYSQQTVSDLMYKSMMQHEIRSDIREQHQKICPEEVHDWFVAWKVK